MFASLHIYGKLIIHPRRLQPTSKVADSRGCTRCCVGRNPYNGYRYLCGAMPTGIVLMQWYEPLNKFMLLKVGLFEFVNILLTMAFDWKAVWNKV